MHDHTTVCVCVVFVILHLTNKWTTVCLYVRCVMSDHPSYVGMRRIASQKFKRGGDKNAGSANKYTKFGQLIIRKIIKIIATIVAF